MFEVFESYIRKYANFTAGELERIRAVAIPRSLKRKEHLLEAGDICRHYTFVCKGCLRAYRIDDEGEEHVLDFETGKCWATQDKSLYPVKPSSDYVEALEDSEVIQIAGDDFRTLIKGMEPFEVFHQKMMCENSAREAERLYSLISRHAEGRYRDFVTNNPELSLRLPLYMIASYLGISRETLSRIRGDRTFRTW